MKKLLEYIPFHLTLCLILGIIIQFYTKFWELSSGKLIILLCLFSLLLLFFKNKKCISFTSWILFFFIGITTVFIQNDKNDKRYFENSISKNNTAILVIKKVLKSNNYYDKYISNVIQINSQKTIGKVILNIKKEQQKSVLSFGDKLFLRPDFKTLKPPLNPHQFNYKNYLIKQGIHRQVFTESSKFIQIENSSFSLQGLVFLLREKLKKSLLKYNFSENELAVINALLLGERKNLSKELINDYSRAGAIHILAISGLHIGILLWILNLFFSPLEKIKKGKLLKTILIILLLWMFALIAGLSASVVRAVTMFTAIAIGQSFQRKNSVEHSIIISAFLLLICKPMFLFDVGFQLSYLAVFGIIWIQPKLFKLYNPKQKIGNYFWQLFTVSIAAQIGVLPISLYYFNQFPSLFWLSNFIIIPFLGTILMIGLFIIIFSLITILPQWLTDSYGFIISFMNNFVNWISKQEQFLFKEISISFWLMLLFYILIISLFRLLLKLHTKRILHFLLAIILLQTILITEKHQRNTKQELIVFHNNKKSIIGIRRGKKLTIYSNLDSIKIQQPNSITSYRIAEKLKPIYKTKMPTTFSISDKNILLVDSLGVYKIKKAKKWIVILQYSPKINLNRLINRLKPIQIIADGSNYKSYVQNWEAICSQKKIPFHFTGKNGAYISSNLK